MEEEKIYVIIDKGRGKLKRFEVGQLVKVNNREKKISDIYVNADQHWVTLKFEDGSATQFNNITYTVFIPAPKPQDYAPNTSASSSLA